MDIKGKRVFTIVTKNDRGEVVGINQIRPTINSVLGEDFFDEFNKRSKGKSIIKKEKKVQGKKKAIYELRPTIVGN